MVSFIESLGFRKFGKISFGLAGALFLLWTLFNSSSFVPAGLETKYLFAFLGYGVLGVYIFGREDIKAKLEQVSLIRALPFFLVSVFLSFFLFSFIFGFVDVPQDIFASLQAVPFYLLLANALIFAFVETSVWQGVLDEKIGILGSVIIAGLFHMFLWTGSLFGNFIGSAILFFSFSMFNFYAVKVLSRNGIPQKLSVVLGLVLTIGFHAGYNMAKYRVFFG